MVLQQQMSPKLKRLLRGTGVLLGSVLSLVLAVLAMAADCPSLSYGSLPIGLDKSEVLSMMRRAGCDVQERPKGYPDGLFLIDTEAIQVEGLPFTRPFARVTCPCWARVQHADLVFSPSDGHPLYLVERRFEEDETNPQRVLEKFRALLDPLVGYPGTPKFQDHRLKGLGLDRTYRTHFMYWYDWRRDIRSYLIVKEVKQGTEEIYVGHIWMPVIEAQFRDPEGSASR